MAEELQGDDALFGGRRQLVARSLLVVVIIANDNADVCEDHECVFCRIERQSVYFIRSFTFLELHRRLTVGVNAPFRENSVFGHGRQKSAYIAVVREHSDDWLVRVGRQFRHGPI